MDLKILAITLLSSLIIIALLVYSVNFEEGKQILRSKTKTYITKAHVKSDKNVFHCGQKDIEKDFKPILSKKSKNGLKYSLLAKNKQNFQKIRWFLDYSNFQHTGEWADYIKNSLMPAAITYLNKRFSVIPRTTPLKVPAELGGVCYKANVPAIHITDGVPDVDIIMYISSETVDASTTFADAWATTCANDADNGKRPMVGQVNFNYPKIRVDTSERGLSGYVRLTAHEFIHSLGFSPSQFKNFANQVYDQEKNVITSTRVIEKAKTFYGCSNINSIPFEDEGEAGSKGAHWERSIMYPEIMNAIGDSAGGYFSIFTAALFEESNWYQISQEGVEKMTFGLNEGCDFIQYGCSGIKSKYFCNNGIIGCAFTGISYGVCSSSEFLNGCNLINSYTNGFCIDNVQNDPVWGTTYGANSRCFESNIIKKMYSGTSSDLRCFKSQCYGNSLILTLENGDTVTCTEKGQKITDLANFSGWIKCPDINAICS